MAAIGIIGRLKSQFLSRSFSCGAKKKTGLILGAYTDPKGGFLLTPTTSDFNKRVEGRIEEQLKAAGLSKSESRLFYDFKIGNDYFDVVSVVGLGSSEAGLNQLEDLDEAKENVRCAAAAGLNQLKSVKCTEVFVSDLGNAEAASEGANLASWQYQDFKIQKNKKTDVKVDYYGLVEHKKLWDKGKIKADAQNLVRWLSESPANVMTPTKFCEVAKKRLEKIGALVEIHDETWARSQGMGSFLSVTQGSVEPAKFLEVHYKCGGSAPNHVFVGKGVTFDTGGISIKPSMKMDEMRADMTGAAVVVATIEALAKLQVPINIIGLTPLCENMPSGKATKPGDIIKAMNGKHIIVDNTDAEGRLILADALCYAQSFNPKVTVDIATLTGAMTVVASNVCFGAFTHYDQLWAKIKLAGCVTGDRAWRLPLYKAFTKKVTDCDQADVLNSVSGGGGSSTAAAFLKEFAPEGEWLHLDIANVMKGDTSTPYLTPKRMSGRSTRTVIELFSYLAEAD